MCSSAAQRKGCKVFGYEYVLLVQLANTFDLERADFPLACPMPVAFDCKERSSHARSENGAQETMFEPLLL